MDKCEEILTLLLATNEFFSGKMCKDVYFEPFELGYNNKKEKIFTSKVYVPIIIFEKEMLNMLCDEKGKWLGKVESYENLKKLHIDKIELFKNKIKGILGGL